MAKTAYSKLQCKINKDEIPCLFNGLTFAVKQYLPVQEKLNLISNVIMCAHDLDSSYSNPVKVEIYKALEMIYAYTDISFTEKQMENTAKLFDEVYSSGLLKAVMGAIPGAEINIIDKGVKDSIESVYAYQNSVLGVLDTLKTDYSELNLDIDSLKKDLANAENLDIVKDVVTKLG